MCRLKYLMRRREIHIYKNWKIVIDRTLNGALRVRASVVNKSDFIFYMSRRGKPDIKRYPGTKKMLTGFADFDKKFSLRANIAGTAKEFFSGAEFRASLEELSDFVFCIKDEDGILAFFFPHEADVLVMHVKRERASLKVIKIFENALDALAGMGILDRDNEPLGIL